MNSGRVPFPVGISLIAAFIVAALIATSAVAQKRRKDVPPAPLPSAVVNAKKVFLTNGGGSDLAYDAFYSEMKQWGKYKIVGSPDEAGIIVELAYHVEHGGTAVWSSTNSYDGSTQVHSAQILDPQLTLTIYDAKSKNSLWSTIDHRRIARLEKNREKETINSAGRLVDELKTRANLAEISRNEVTDAPPLSTAPAPIRQQPTPIPTAVPEQVSPSVREALGTVSVTSSPDGAEIFIDSVGYGHAPAILKLSAGKHSIQLVRHGYKDWTSDLEVRENSIVNVTAKLEK
jgi:hypothetical protein